MDKQIKIRLLAAAVVLMLLSGCVFACIHHWISAALVWVGAFDCLVAALNFNKRKDE